MKQQNHLVLLFFLLPRTAELKLQEDGYATNLMAGGLAKAMTMQWFIIDKQITNAATYIEHSHGDNA